MCQMQRRASSALKTYPSRRFSSEAATTSDDLVRSAEETPTASGPSGEHCTILGTHCRANHGICTLPTLSTGAPSAICISMPTWTTWPSRRAITQSASCTPLCVWSSRTACPTGPLPGTCGETIGCLFPLPRSKTGSKARGKKAVPDVQGEYLDEALSDFSGYIAADELYDGPFCVLSIVDNRRFRRLMYEVLDHDPTHEDITAFFQRFKEALDARGLCLSGITTDGSPLYPEPIAQVFGNVSHQLCQFHVLQDITRTVLKAVARVRRDLKRQQPKLGRGRPGSKTARKLARKKKRLQDKIADLFKHRHLFVQRSLTDKEHRQFLHITRGRPELRRLREIMDEVYRLFDRRCRVETARGKLVKLRQRVRRFRALRDSLKKLLSPTLEKALTFLDDSLLPATSNAVERGNRRHRKMQKTVYRVRTAANIRNRIALDMLRDAHGPSRGDTTETLHLARARA